MTKRMSRFIRRARHINQEGGELRARPPAFAYISTPPDADARTDDADGTKYDEIRKKSCATTVVGV